MGTYLFTELAQDMGDLTGFGETQFADVVLEGDDFGRLDEDCLAGRGFVLDKAGKLAFAAGRDRNQVFPIPDGDACIGVHQALGLRLF